MFLLLLSSSLVWTSSVQGASIPQIIDLGYPMDNNTAFWPGVMRFEITQRTRDENQGGVPWFAVNAFQTAEHVGTHVDAPFHFIKNGWKLGDIPQDRFFTKAVLVDVSNETNENFELLPSHITNWEQKNNKLIPENSVVLFRFGWAKLNYNNYNRYYGIKSSNSSELNFPGISSDAAKTLVQRRVHGVGVDTPSLDAGKNVLFNAHRTLLNASIFGIENLNLSSTDLPTGREFGLHILPIKITEGTGAPARVIAFVEPEEKSRTILKISFLDRISNFWEQFHL